MSNERYFLDTFFVIALLNPRDQAHDDARQWLGRTRAAKEVWTTDIVLIEIADSLSATAREAAVEFVRSFGFNVNARIARMSADLLDRGLALYQSRQDKTWGLTDCISFVVMEEQGLHDALTAD